MDDFSIGPQGSDSNKQDHIWPDFGPEIDKTLLQEPSCEPYMLVDWISEINISKGLSREIGLKHDRNARILF